MLAQLSAFLTSTSSAEAANEAATIGIVSMLAGMFAVMMIVGLVWYILSVIAYWKIFTKAGEPGWKSIIPFYNSYTQFKITWDAKYYLILIVLAIAMSVITNVTGKEQNGLATAVLAVLTLIVIVISVIADFKLAAAFGHGMAFALGLIFFSPIFMLILGLGSSQYIGPNGIPEGRR